MKTNIILVAQNNRTGRKIFGSLWNQKDVHTFTTSSGDLSKLEGFHQPTIFIQSGIKYANFEVQLAVQRLIDNSFTTRWIYAN